MNIEPVKPVIKSELTEQEIKLYKDIGIDYIKNGKVAVCTMAGGQGTRLGHAGPKGTFIVPFTKIAHKSIFEINADVFKKCHKKNGVWPQWYIMTSKENDQKTREFFVENNYFDIPNEKVVFFIQGEFPLVRENGEQVLDENGKIVSAANGNGGIFKALYDEGILKDMEERQIEYLVSCNVDNILINPFDEISIGVLASKKTELGIKSIARTDAKEKVGSIVLKDGKVTVIEYIDMPKELLEAVDDEGKLLCAESHFGCNYISLDLLKRIAEEKLPIHEAHKENDKYGKYIKKEMFIFDGFEKALSSEVIRVKREDEFAPIKNMEGQDSPTTAIDLFQKFYNL